MPLQRVLFGLAFVLLLFRAGKNKCAFCYRNLYDFDILKIQGAESINSKSTTLYSNTIIGVINVWFLKGLHQSHLKTYVSIWFNFTLNIAQSSNQSLLGCNLASLLTWETYLSQKIFHDCNHRIFCA